MNFRELGCECVDRINLAPVMDYYWAVMKPVMNFQVPLKSGNLLTIRDMWHRVIGNKQNFVIRVIHLCCQREQK